MRTRLFILKPCTTLWSEVGKMDSNNGDQIEAWGLAPFPGNGWQLKA